MYKIVNDEVDIPSDCYLMPVTRPTRRAILKTTNVSKAESSATCTHFSQNYTRLEPSEACPTVVF